MPICSFKYCNNNGKNGFRLFRFPREKLRRELWIQKSNYEGFNTDPRLCECHFDDSAYENARQDGRRLLKSNAVPTLFSWPHDTDTNKSQINYIDTENKDECEPSKRNCQDESYSDESGKLFTINTYENHKSDEDVDNDGVIESADNQDEKILPVDEIIQDKSGNVFTINTSENHKSDEDVDNDGVIELADKKDEKILPVDESIQDKSGNVFTINTSENHKSDENVDDDGVIESADNQDEKMLPVDEIIQRKIEEVLPGFGTTGKTILMMVIDDKERDKHIEAHGGYIRDGTLRQNNEIKMLKNRMEQLERFNTNLKKKNKSLKVKLNHLNSVQKRTSRKEILIENIKKNPSLFTLLSRKKKSTLAWSPECLKLATQIRFAVGSKGYIYLKDDLGLPLPSYSTICKYVSKLDFGPGLLNDVIELMKNKLVTHTSTNEADSILEFDEMDISPGLDYDKSSDSYIGHTTCHVKNDKLGTKIIVYMLRGLYTNWKQVVAWHLTTANSDEIAMSKLILEIIREYEAISYNVHGLVSDMGTKNIAIWRKLGFKTSNIKNISETYIQHPFIPNRFFYLFPDSSHLLKNMRMALVNNRIITIDHEIVTQENLPSNEIKYQYLEQLFEIQKKQCKGMELAPNITAEILNPTNYNKMNVAAAAHVFNIKTSGSIETLVNIGLMEKDALTTAWYLRKVREWFEVMNGRHLGNAIKKENISSQLKILDNFLYILEKLSFGSAWKPVQTGIKISVLNTTLLIDYLFKEKNYKYFFTSRLSQDALENLFSTLRKHGNNHPTALQAKRCLRLITICQFLSTQRGGTNYETDDDHHYVDFFKQKISSTQEKKRKKQENLFPVEKCMFDSPFWDAQEYLDDLEPISNILQCNVVNNALGCAISYVLRTHPVCSDCMQAFTAETNGRYSVYTNSISLGMLINPSSVLFNYIALVEAHLLEHLNNCSNHPQLFKHLQFMIKKIPYKKGEGVSRDAIIPVCKQCNAFDAIRKRYIYIRQMIHLRNEKKKQREGKKNNFASKTAMRQIAII